jgi:hypothetical protein
MDTGQATRYECTTHLFRTGCGFDAGSEKCGYQWSRRGGGTGGGKQSTQRRIRTHTHTHTCIQSSLSIQLLHTAHALALDILVLLEVLLLVVLLVVVLAVLLVLLVLLVVRIQHASSIQAS